MIKKLTVTPRFRNTIADLDASAAWKKDLVELKDPAGRAMILNLGSANRYAYVFLEYGKHDYRKVELVYDTGSGEKRITKDEFPWEFTVPLTASVTRMSFHLSAERKDGETHTGETHVLSVGLRGHPRLRKHGDQEGLKKVAEKTDMHDH